MGKIKSLNHYLAEYATAEDPAEFQRDNPDHVFVQRGDLESKLSSSATASRIGSRSSLILNENPELLRVHLIGPYGSHDFKGTLYSVGSDAANDVHLDHESILRRHAQLFFKSGIWQVADLGSPEGVAIGEPPQKLEPKKIVELNNSNVVRFGQVPVTYFTPQGFYDFLTLQKDMAQGR